VEEVCGIQIQEEKKYPVRVFNRRGLLHANSPSNFLKKETQPKSSFEI
jgi:hypothetical protein